MVGAGTQPPIPCGILMKGTKETSDCAPLHPGDRAKETPADIIGQQGKPPEAREGQLVIMAGLVEMGDSFAVRRTEYHRHIVSRHCWTSQQWHPTPITRFSGNEKKVLMRRGICAVVRWPADCICGAVG